MTTNFNRKLFVNLAVRDLEKSKEFFAQLGFSFDPRMTDANGACMIVGADSSVMLLSENKFKDFVNKPLIDARKGTEALLAISCENRADVEAMVKKAVAAGGSFAMDSQDHGFMFAWSFCDLDGHHWEPFYMDLEKFPN